MLRLGIRLGRAEEASLPDSDESRRDLDSDESRRDPDSDESRRDPDSDESRRDLDSDESRRDPDSDEIPRLGRVKEASLFACRGCRESRVDPSGGRGSNPRFKPSRKRRGDTRELSRRHPSRVRCVLLPQSSIDDSETGQVSLLTELAGHGSSDSLSSDPPDRNLHGRGSHQNGSVRRLPSPKFIVN
jgi:hypothetical protein